MVGWPGAAALAGIGGLVSQRKRWQQVPYLGAIAAVAVFVQWRSSHNRIDSEVEKEVKEPDVASTDGVEIVDEKLDLALEPGVPDEESDPYRPGSAKGMLGSGELLLDCGDFILEENGNLGVPNWIVPVNQTELHPLDVQDDGAGTKLKELVSTPNFKDVTEDPLLSGSVSLKPETPLIETWVLSAEAEERPGVVAASSEASNPNPAEKLDFHDAGGNLRSTQVVEDVKNLLEIPESLLFSTAVDPQVDKNVDAITESHADANNVMSDHFSMLSVKTCKPNWVFQTDGSNSPIAEETTKSPSNADAGTNSEDEINMPQQEGYCSTDDEGECHTPRCTAAVLGVDPTGLACSSGGSEDWNSDISSPQDMEQGLPVREPCYLESEDEYIAQSPGPVNSICVDAKGVEDELSNSARREYAKRLRSYDEYLADPELSPTMRSQVLRARASVALYFDESDDDQ